MHKYDVAVIGGGAGGLATACTLLNLNKNLSVIVVEGCDRAGKKIASTGNGQGNVSNADLGAEHFHGSLKNVAEKLCSEGLYDPLSLFDFLFVKDKLGRIYPAGKQASALSDCLIRKAKTTGVQLLTSTRVTAIEKGFVLTLSSGEKIGADYVVLATGGKAQKQFGTDGTSYSLAQNFKHTLTPLYPSLVQLKCDTRYTKSLKGIRAECRVTALAGDEKLASYVGDVIFTDYGVSGNAIFYVSAYCAGRSDVTLSLEFLPEISEAEIERSIKDRLSAGYAWEEVLCGTLHNQIARAVARRCANGGGKDGARELAHTVKNFTLRAEGSLGFDYAQVTKGGIPESEVDGNLQSRLVPGLYFAGEILDVDGDCGGYNLTWALASGMHVATAIAEKMSGNGND